MGSIFLKREKSHDKAIRVDEEVNKNDAFQKIIERAQACRDSGSTWHNHHLPPQCSFNPQKGKHCIVFEDESSGDALYAFYGHDPVDNLSELETLFFAK